MTAVAQIKKVVMQLAYQIHGGNYGSDIALLFLENAVEQTSVQRSVCADWNAENLDDHLVENNTGQILGWGVTENDTHSQSLRMTTLMELGFVMVAPAVVSCSPRLWTMDAPSKD
ncbi:Limulus clotting factor C [Gryllus bimaculatus]|nr:Limulus clotting factor C [Gryllus bimaculatus]